MENNHKVLHFLKNKALLNNKTPKQEILFVGYECLTIFDACVSMIIYFNIPCVLI